MDAGTQKIQGSDPKPRVVMSLVARSWPELAILLLAALTRCWRLDYHSFWFDEAVSLRWAASDPRYTWDVTLQLVQEKHPPVYYNRPKGTSCGARSTGFFALFCCAFFKNGNRA